MTPFFYIDFEAPRDGELDFVSTNDTTLDSNLVALCPRVKKRGVLMHQGLQSSGGEGGRMCLGSIPFVLHLVSKDSTPHPSLFTEVCHGRVD